MKDLTKVFPSSVIEDAVFENGYWQLPHNVYISDCAEIVIPILDSAIDETLIICWEADRNMWLHYTNCFGLGGGNDNDTMFILEEWYANAVN